MFDTHCHLNFQKFKNNLSEVVERARESGISHINIPGTDVKSSKVAVDIAQDFDNTYASVGIHPHHIFKYQIPHPRHPRENGDPEHGFVPAKAGIGVGNGVSSFLNSELKEIENLVVNKKVVAVGEIGLDRHYYLKTKYKEYEIDERLMALQKDVFIKQINIAIKNRKSLVLHNREATDEFLKLFSGMWSENMSERVVFHCCEPNKKLLEFAKNNKIFIGVDGDVTYNKEKEDFIKQIPLGILVLETDSPFLTPEPARSINKFPNEPKNLFYIAEFIANKLSLPLEELKKITFENSKKLFNIN